MKKNVCWVIVIVLFTALGCMRREADENSVKSKDSGQNKSASASLQPLSASSSSESPSTAQTEQKAREGWKIFTDSSNAYSIQYPDVFEVSEKKGDDKELTSKVIFKNPQDFSAGNIILEVYTGGINEIEKKLITDFEFISKKHFVVTDIAVVKYIGVSNTDELFISPVTSNMTFSARIQGIDTIKVYDEMIKTLVFFQK